MKPTGKETIILGYMNEWMKNSDVARKCGIMRSEFLCLYMLVSFV
jgi:hypothetical protein